MDASQKPMLLIAAAVAAAAAVLGAINGDVAFAICFAIGAAAFLLAGLRSPDTPT